MSYTVKFNFRDSRGRSVSRSLHNDEPLIADVLTDVGELTALWNPLTDLAFENVVVTRRDDSDAFAGATVSNRDENTSVKVLAEDGYVYDFDLPDIPDALHPGETLDVTDAAVVAFFDEFLTAGPWRINLRTPTAIASLISGKLDK